MIVIFCIFFRR